MSGLTREQYEAHARAKARGSYGARQRAIEETIVERGLRWLPFGAAERLVGPGTDILIADRRALTLADLAPVMQ